MRIVKCSRGCGRRDFGSESVGRNY